MFDAVDFTLLLDAARVFLIPFLTIGMLAPIVKILDVVE